MLTGTALGKKEGLVLDAALGCADWAHQKEHLLVRCWDQCLALHLAQIKEMGWVLQLVPWMRLYSAFEMELHLAWMKDLRSLSHLATWNAVDLNNQNEHLLACCWAR